MAELHGKLKVGDFGYTMPIQDPIIGPPPYLYRGFEAIYMEWETDYESASQLLPEDLVFAYDPPHAFIMFIKYPFSSTLGIYDEFVLYIPVLFENRRYDYADVLYVGTEIPLIAGREIWGIPKKIADVIEIKFVREEVIGYLERPAGNRLCTAVMQPETNLKKEDWVCNPVLFMKLIPHPTLGQKPEVCELVAIPDFEVAPVPMLGLDKMAGKVELWGGKGSLVFNSPTAIDPLNRVPVKKIVRCIYGTFTMYLPDGKVLKKYV